MHFLLSAASLCKYAYRPTKPIIISSHLESHLTECFCPPRRSFQQKPIQKVSPHNQSIDTPAHARAPCSVSPPLHASAPLLLPLQLSCPAHKAGQSLHQSKRQSTHGPIPPSQGVAVVPLSYLSPRTAVQSYISHKSTPLPSRRRMPHLPWYIVQHYISIHVPTLIAKQATPLHYCAAAAAPVRVKACEVAKSAGKESTLALR